MGDDTACPSCGTDDDVTGERRGELIRLTCGACSVSWDRDPSPHCSRCGGREMRAVPQAVVEKSRGTQLSISFIRMVHLCVRCDAGVLADQAQTNVPMRAAENPVLDDPAGS